MSSITSLVRIQQHEIQIMIAKLKRLLVIGSELVQSGGRLNEEESYRCASIDANSEVGCIKERHVQRDS